VQSTTKQSTKNANNSNITYKIKKVITGKKLQKYFLPALDFIVENN
jgi:hypothetical protein